ncbi:16S rRNA (uracil(1498)-N(3))-methyltransferase [Marinospirillum perlucidum]|uniref:16S rRNA (uracil(1498)-N(3))-methyltransferase n=1 Tax=Marinospirillum perlucidum TaxID=1982602 RepID=UPI000DF38C92|nr:16S rRNA (uracil(1498)-N(3))-methyltransferase [Marinospirillum perlucidum]
MNLLLLQQEDLLDSHTALLTGRQHQHLKTVHKKTTGDQLKAGLVGGLMGSAEIIEQNETRTRIHLQLEQSPPPPLPLRLLLALPRPRMLARSLEHLSTLGVKDIHLLQTARVEKSYWQSPELKPEKIHQHLLLGLEQARDTLLPRVHLHTRFRPFVEDELPGLICDTRKLVAHPGNYPQCPRGLNEAVTLAIGPEGGFVDYEIEKLQEQGFTAVQLGPRILRVETAVTALLARLF